MDHGEFPSAEGKSRDRAGFGNHVLCILHLGKQFARICGKGHLRSWFLFPCPAAELPLAYPLEFPRVVMLDAGLNFSLTNLSSPR